MDLKLEIDDIDAYLKSTDAIDYMDPDVKAVADELSRGVEDEVELARRVYEFVRDKIAHSADINGDVVTCSASEVLEHRQGICYAKSHLLAAILRCLDIPTGLCYQKLNLGNNEAPRLVLHGLNAIYLKSQSKWIRVDARGNKEGVCAEFDTESEKLAFSIREELGESDQPLIYAYPPQNVIESLKASKTVNELINNLPSEL